ncbi:MAG: response regulator transcription factor [Raoultibacter sp.]
MNEKVTKIQVGLIDDHALVREGLRVLLEKEEDISIVGEAGNYAAVLRLLELPRLDVVLLDLQMPDVSGFAVCKMIKNERPEIQVLILSAFLNPELLNLCTQSGASGYLLKDTEGFDIAAAVKVVFSGGKIFDEQVTKLAQDVDSQISGIAGLSNRELDVLRYLCKGMTNQEISVAMKISVNTVKSLLGAIMQKLNCRNRVEVVLTAQTNYLI